MGWFGNIWTGEWNCLDICIEGLCATWHKSCRSRQNQTEPNWITYTFSKLSRPNWNWKLLWPLLIVNVRIPGLIWRGTAYFVRNNTTTHFWRQISTLETQNIAYFLQSDTVLGFVIPFPLIFNVISSEKSCLISVPFLRWPTRDTLQTKNQRCKQKPNTANKKETLQTRKKRCKQKRNAANKKETLQIKKVRCK